MHTPIERPDAVGMETIVAPFDRETGGVLFEEMEGGIDEVVPSDALAMINEERERR